MSRKIIMSFSIVLAIITSLFVIFNFMLFPKKYKANVNFYAEKYNLETELVYAVIKTESNFKTTAKSPSGAMGLMQLMPSTAKWIAKELGVTYDENSLYDYDTNINFGCYYLRYLFDRFDYLDVVICAYNAGETVVKNWLNEDGKLIEDKISFFETKNYLKKVKSYYRVYGINEIGK